MPSNVSLSQFQFPAPTQMHLTCSTLVVGNTLAAYTATAAALKAGEQVCWVTPGSPTTSFALALQSLATTTRPWWMAHARLPFAHFAATQTQRQWLERFQTQARNLATDGTEPMTLPLPNDAIQTFSSADTWQDYVQRHQLTVLAHTRPHRVLYKEDRQQRQITQLWFENLETHQRVSVRADWVIEATTHGDLLRLGGLEALSDTQGKTLRGQAMQILTDDHWLRTAFPKRQARGACFDDTIGLAYALAGEQTPSWYLSALFNRNPVLPFTVPLRALIPTDMDGLMLTGQRIAIASSTFAALSPATEWALGETSGYLAAFLRQERINLAELPTQPRLLRQFQRQLVQRGIPLFWFDDVAQDDPDFEAIQMGAVADVLRTTSRRDLHFRPEGLVSRAVLASALSRLMQAIDPAAQAIHPTHRVEMPELSDVTAYHWAADPIRHVVTQAWMSPLEPQRFVPSQVVTHRQLYTCLGQIVPEMISTVYHSTPVDDRPVKRRDLARLLYGIYQHRRGLG